MPLILFGGDDLYLLANQPLAALKFFRSTKQVRGFGLRAKPHEVLMVQEYETLLFGHLSMASKRRTADKLLKGFVGKRLTYETTTV